MGWVWYVNDLTKYLPDALTLAEVTPEGYDVSGLRPDIPLEEIALEPEDPAIPDPSDPYVVEMPFPHPDPGPDDQEALDGSAPEFLPRSQDMDLVVSAIDIPRPEGLRQYLRKWQREDLRVRV